MNNKKSILLFQIFSAVFVSILGTIFHFTYEWSNNNPIVGLFSAVNESTWEHLKLLFFPMLITIIIGFFYFKKDFFNFLCAKTIGLISAIIFIVVFFYTYTGILGTNIAFFNIILFYLAVLLGEFISYKIIVANFRCNNKLSIFILFLLLLCFFIFTFFPPKIGLFKSPYL